MSPLLLAFLVLVGMNAMVVLVLVFRQKAREAAEHIAAVEAAKAFQRAVIDEAARKKELASQERVEGIQNADEDDLLRRARELADGVRK